MSGSTDPPKRPWHGGDPDYIYSRLEVEIVEDKNGWVFSGHDFMSPVDAENAAKMRNGGVKQVAYGLTTEALRREAFLCLLVELSKAEDGPESWLRVVRDDEEYRERLCDMVARGALATLMGMAQKMLPHIAREVVHMALQQAKGPKNPSIG